jgi:ABC-2 type transport system ATP-binding protein
MTSPPTQIPRDANLPLGASTSAAAVRVRGVTKRYGDTWANRDISLTIFRGEIVALLGKNGAGKTTLIDAVLGLQNADSGTVEVFGRTPHEAIRRSLVGAMQQTGALLPEYTVAQLLSMFAATHVAPLPLDVVLRLSRLDAFARRRIGKLSGGEQQRVRMALALLPNAPLLILDEPTAGMDAVARRHFWALMRELAAAGRTIVFATHYLAEAQDFAERTLIMRNGEIVADAPTEELRRRDEHHVLSITIDPASRVVIEPRLLALPGAEEWTISWPPSGAEPVSGAGPEAGAASLNADPTNGHAPRLVIRGNQLDGAARALLDAPGAHDLELAPSTLEDIFTSLTEES